jgi:exopolysaccharide biosynthesis protein
MKTKPKFNQVFSFCLTGILLWFISCSKEGSRTSTIPMNWKSVDSIDVNLPGGIKLFAGLNETLPLKAWYVRINEKDPYIYSKVVVSDDTTDNRETISSFARDLNARVVVNGGYFTMNKTPASHYGLLMTDGKIIEPATNQVIRDSIEYNIARAAFGFYYEDGIDISWVVSKGDSIYSWPKPPANRPGMPADSLIKKNAEVWNVHDAIGAGPALIMNGEIKITSDEEVFFGTSIPRTHPRTAIGYTKEGDLILMVVDGRQEKSRGVTLEELAVLMQDLEVVEAMNLDGGGSSALVIDNKLINLPAGKKIEREVMSAIATFTK